MALTKEQWNHAAEKAAAEKYGRDHAGWYIFKRYGLAPTVVALCAGFVGWLLYKIWTVARDALAGDLAGPPSWSILCFVALVLATLAAYRPGRVSFPSLPFLIVKAVVFIAAWVMLIVATVAAV